MAGFRKIYTSQNQYLEDIASTSDFFDADYYETAKEAGQGIEYLQIMAGTKDQISSSFDKATYDRLSGADKFNYYVTENLLDKNSEEYKTNKTYFDQQIKAIKNQEIYDSLNGFEKTMNSIGGWLGNAFLQVGGIVEGLIDAGATLVGAFGSEEFKKDVKEFVAGDATGYNAAQASMNDWINKYTFIDKNVVTQALNDVTTGIVRMTPMIVGGALAPYTGGVSAKIGTSIYYASMAGNTSEQAIVANPDINYGNLLVYTAGSVGLEAVTEWASGKLFGDDVISSLMKGQKYAPTGTIVKTIAKNFGTEALEEAVAEIFGSLMYAGLVTGDVNDIASIGDIFYASIIGGLTGAVMSGGQIATTKRMVVTQDGQLKYRSELTDAELKTAKKLKLSESWGLQSLIQQSQQALSTPDNVTQLMAKTGKSISQLQTENAEEFEKAVAKDTKIKTQQANAILDLANLMSTIGVEQFTKSAELLKNNADLATEYVNNFLNHTDVANKKAAEVFSANYPGKSFTPTAVPSKPNQALAEALRQAFPQLKVVFGTFGSEDGLPVRAINKGETYLFLDENMVSQKGYQQVLHETIRYQLADQLMQEINILDNAEANGIVKLVTDLDVDYDKLTKEQKLSIAQILCFDPVNSRRLFKGANKTHAKIFNYITDQSEYVKKFGRQTEANKMRYHDLLEIRDMYIRNIAETISNNEDVQAAKEQYNLTDEETKTKIIDKTENTILNDTIAVMRQNLDKNVIARQEAIEDLLQNRVETNKSVPFDWSNLYNEAYYNEDWVTQIKQQQQTQDFQEALRAHLIASHKVDFSIIEHSTLVDTIQNNVSIDELNKLAETLFTKEYLDTNPDLQVSVADALYTMIQTEETDSDSVLIENEQIKGTGKLKPFINTQLFAKKPTFDSKFVEDIQPYIVEDVELEKQAINNTTLYKGVTSEITDDFDNTQGDKKRIVEGATWLTDNIEFAKTYANMQTGGVLTRTVTINNPLVIDAQGRYFSDAVPGITADDLARYAQEQGYDSLIIKNIIDVGPYLTNATDKTTRSKPSTDVVIFKDTTATINKLKPVDTKAPSKKATDVAKDLKLQKSAIRENAKTQKIKTSDLLANKDAKNKYNELNGLVSDEKLTAYQGEHDQQTIITTSRDIYQDPENQTFFENLTSNDYQAIRRLLLLDQTMESDARMALLDVYAYEHRNTQFKDIKDFVTYTYQRMVSGGMRYGGLSNSLYGSHAVSSLVSEIETDTGNDIEIPVNIVEHALSKLGIEGQTVQEYQTYLRKQVTDLEKQLKQTKDPYDKHVLREQINELQHLLDTIDDEDFSGVLDAVINMLNNKETDVAKNQEAISEIHQRLIAYVLQHSKMGPNNKIQMSKSKSVLSPEAKEKLITGLMAINSFRYMCMLSSPTTMVRNAVSNTAISVQAIAEDAVAGKFEKSGLLATESQVNYVGEYNDDFSKYIDKEYGARIDADTEGDKYTTTNIEKLRNQYAQEKDPLKRNTITAKIKELEQKGLSDKPWTKRRTLRNLKNMFAGAKTRILLDCESWLIAKYRKSTPAKNMTQSLLIERITNAEIKNLYKDAISNSNTSLKSTIMLGEKLKIDLCDKNSENSIYKRALYRSNKLLFKTDNWLSKTMRSLRKSHPVAAELLTWFQPFMKVAFNTTLYAIDRSPIGIAKGVIKTLQTRTAYISDMKRLITDYYKQQYREVNKGVKDWSFDESKFNEWFKQSAKTNVRNALMSNKYTDIKQVYDTMVDEGLIPRQALGSDNPYMRAEAFEALGQGIVGTSLMTLGLILAAVTDAFDYDDDDDYLGPVIRIGDLKIALDDLTPFTTMFTVGAMLGSNNIDNSMEAAFKVFVDQTMFSVIDSAIVYSDDLGDFFGNQIINTVQQFIPAITKGLSKSIYNAKPDKSGNWFEKLIKTTGSNLITFGWAVPRKINPYTGEKLPYYESGRFEGFVNWIFPIQFRIDNKSTVEKEAIRIDAETTGLSGKFNINTVDYVVKDKEKYAKYRADYIESQFDNLVKGKQEVTVEDENGKRITTTYDKLNDKQKKNVINRLYTEATTMTKIKWWTDQGNKYVVTNRDQYDEYRKMFNSNNIIYKKTWTKSKFVES